MGRATFLLQVSVRLRGDGPESRCTFPRGASLGDAQQHLCRTFRRRFPALKAVLMTTDGVRYDEVVQLPFVSCVEGAVFDVIFVDTDDPYRYDKMDRTRKKITLEEEVAHDEAVRMGATTEDLETWVCGLRDPMFMLPDPAVIF